MIRKAVMLAVIVHPVLHIALHGDHQVQHGQHLGGCFQLARLVLHDPVQRANPGIADKDGQRHDAEAERQVPPVQVQRLQREAKHDHCNE